MAKSVLRVVFDTNAFMSKPFEALRASRFEGLCAQGRVRPIYGHVFLEETLRAYGNDAKRGELVSDWLPLIGRTIGRVLEDFVVIWHRELVEGRGKNANLYMRPDEQESMLAGLTDLKLDGSWHGWEDTKAEREAEAIKRDKQRATSIKIRAEVGAWRKSAPPRGKATYRRDFKSIFASEVDRAGRMFIGTLVPCWNPSEVANRWSRDKDNYPYFSNFVLNMLYISHFAATRSNEKIDLNAQSDLDVMTHLLHGDALVTNETGFMRSAFEDLWRPRGKTIFTSQQFVELIDKF